MTAGSNRGHAGLPPVRKRLGQHFLTDTRVLDRIVGALALTGLEPVIEIGPGRGALSDRLVALTPRLVLVEYDRALAAWLRERYADRPTVEVVQADVLTVELGTLAQGPYVLAGNIPYYITTPIIFHALKRPRPERAVFLVQREVAERLTAAPGTPEYGALSVNVQALADVAQIAGVPRGAFRPPPRVDSAIVRIEPRRIPAIAAGDEAAYRELVQRAFGMRRKQMRRVVRSLRDLPAQAAEALLERAGVDPSARPETLSPARFAVLLDAIRS